MEDKYLTISAVSTAKYVDKRSVFYAFAVPVFSEEEVDSVLKEYRRKYYDARHICYAFCLNADRSVSRSSDNGEPSGTAGRPIMGVLQSYGLTNVCLLVVRYFGGIKLGTSGLAAAYKDVAEQAVRSADIVERTEDISLSFYFEYGQMNAVMSAIKSSGASVVTSQFAMECFIEVRGAKSVIARLKEAFEGKVRFSEDGDK